MKDLVEKLEIVRGNLPQIRSRLGEHWGDFRDKFLAKTAEMENIRQVAVVLEALRSEEHTSELQSH